VPVIGKAPRPVLDHHMAAAEREPDALDTVGAGPARRVHADIGRVLVEEELIDGSDNCAVAATAIEDQPANDSQ
jgi:hypothetical protein